MQVVAEGNDIREIPEVEEGVIRLYLKEATDEAPLRILEVPAGEVPDIPILGWQLFTEESRVGGFLMTGLIWGGIVVAGILKRRTR